MVQIEKNVPPPQTLRNRWDTKGRASAFSGPEPLAPLPYPGPDGNVYQYAKRLLMCMAVGDSCVTEVPDKKEARRVAMSFGVAGQRLRQEVTTQSFKDQGTMSVCVRAWRLS